MGERVVCKNSRRILYAGIVMKITRSGFAHIQREDGKRGKARNGLWLCKKNYSGTWDGCSTKKMPSYWGYSMYNNVERNEDSRGSWLYIGDILDWSAEF